MASRTETLDVRSDRQVPIQPKGRKMGRRAFGVLLGGAGCAMLEACGQSIIPPRDAGRRDSRVKDAAVPADTMQPDTACVPETPWAKHSSSCEVFGAAIMFGETESDSVYTVQMTDYGEDNGKKFVVVSVSDSCKNEARDLKVYYQMGVLFYLGVQQMRVAAPEMNFEYYPKPIAHISLYKVGCTDGGV